MCKEINHENEPRYLNLAARLATHQLIVIIYILATISHASYNKSFQGGGRKQ